MTIPLTFRQFVDLFNGTNPKYDPIYDALGNAYFLPTNHHLAIYLPSQDDANTISSLWVAYRFGLDPTSITACLSNLVLQYRHKEKQRIQNIINSNEFANIFFPCKPYQPRTNKLSVEGYGGGVDFVNYTERHEGKRYDHIHIRNSTVNAFTHLNRDYFDALRSDYGRIRHRLSAKGTITFFITNWLQTELFWNAVRTESQHEAPKQWVVIQPSR